MVSPVHIAKAFEHLKLKVSDSPTDGLKLVKLIEFWSKYGSDLKSPSFHTYLNDFLIIRELISEQSIQDLTIRELIVLESALATISSAFRKVESGDQLHKLVLFSLVRVNSYVGDFHKAVFYAGELTGIENIPGIAEIPYQRHDSFEALACIADSLKPDHSKLGEVLREARERWEGERDCVCDDQALCLLVESDPTNGRSRGILGTLHGLIEIRASQRETEDIVDTVIFGNQLRAQDDPLARVLYNSLAAVRNLPRSFGLENTSNGRLDAHFSIPGSSGVFTGGSIGFAAAVLTYSQLLKPIVQREQKAIPGSVAFTGTVDASGNIGAVNNSTVSDKVQRAFYSHVDILALPEANLDEARTYLKQLNAEYPLRRLRLVSYERLANALTSHDVVRAEKVCFAEFATKKAMKYSRSIKLQIPILIGLLYFLFCLVYPKAWVFFDRNPYSVELTQSGFSVLNQKRVELWSESFECHPLNAELPPIVRDLNGDSKNEVLFLPSTPSNSECQIPAYLHAFNWRGDSLFAVPCAILGATPPDTSLDQHYSVQPLELAVSNSGLVIVTQVYGPGRTHFKFWNSSGEMLGWYVNAGHYGGVGKNFAYDADGKLYFLSFNNLADRASLIVLKPDSCEGLSPPYTGSSSRTRPGTQLQYILFPRSDVNLALNSVYSHADGICILHEGLLQAEIKEGDNLKPVLQYYIDNNCRVIGVNPTDAFTKVRRKLVKDQLLEPMTSTYYDDLRDSVLYWQNSAWVSECELRLLDISDQ